MPCEGGVLDHGVAQLLFFNDGLRPYIDGGEHLDYILVLPAAAAVLMSHATTQQGVRAGTTGIPM